MRYIHTLVFAIVVTCSTQAADPIPRFGIFLNLDLYPQQTPKNALESAIAAIERDRVEYFVSHLLDPAVVAERMSTMQLYFEKVAADQISSTGAGMNLRGTELQARVKERGIELNFRAMADLVRQKIKDEPTNVKEMKLFLSDGTFTDDGTTGRVTHKTIKDKALYFKKIDNRWFLENRKEDAPAPKE